MGRFRSDIKLKAEGFNSKGNFEFIFNTVEDFPELAGIFPKSRTEKIFWVATYYLFHFTKGHCFNDGNKRTAFIAVAVFLYKNGFRFDYNEEAEIRKIKILDEAIESGKDTLIAIKLAFGQDTQSAAYKLVAIIFGLSGTVGLKNFDSPLELYPVLKGIIHANNSVKKEKEGI
ncbi:MAG: type II toxin-antitoxin system death-on-curing family toxin [Candidatus Diapherotrites archaeon]|nr:type II toxin-antitoxin system death-on-curing family toxin [Candidatus Diapherotrites archaeon]